VVVRQSECGDVANIAGFLMDAVSRHEISVADAEAAVLEWTHDADVLDAAARWCDRAGAVKLLHRVSTDVNHAA
jgi:hypothetical protein